MSETSILKNKIFTDNVKWLMSIAVSLAVGYGTYSVMQYRVNQSEENIKELKAEKDKSNDKYNSLDKNVSMINQSVESESKEIKNTLLEIKNDLRALNDKFEKMNRRVSFELP